MCQTALHVVAYGNASNDVVMPARAVTQPVIGVLDDQLVLDGQVTDLAQLAEGVVSVTWVGP